MRSGGITRRKKGNFLPRRSVAIVTKTNGLQPSCYRVYSSCRRQRESTPLLLLFFVCSTGCGRTRVVCTPGVLVRLFVTRFHVTGQGEVDADISSCAWAAGPARFCPLISSRSACPTLCLSVCSRARWETSSTEGTTTCRSKSGCTG